MTSCRRYNYFFNLKYYYKQKIFFSNIIKYVMYIKIKIKFPLRDFFLSVLNLTVENGTRFLLQISIKLN